MRGFLTALGFLTKIPAGAQAANSGNLHKSMAYFPAVGFLLGLILILLDEALTRALPAGLVNLLLLAALALLTGGIHLDGFADTIDSFSSKTKDKQEMLAIMRDSRIGAMAVIALILLILFKYEALNNVPPLLRKQALALMCITSRWCQVQVSYFSRYARGSEGLGRPFIGRVERRDFLLAAAWAVVLSLTVWRLNGAFALIGVSLAAWAAMKYIHKRIGGMTGDTVGAVSEIAEVSTLFFVLILGSVWT